MKRILFIIFIFLAPHCYSQDDWVTNLQMQAGTWKSIGVPYRNIQDSATTASFVKVFNSFKTKPNNNANVTLDSIPTLSLVLLYEFLLFNVGYDAALSDFQTSIVSKRNTNPLLDARCDELEARLASLEAANIIAGSRAYGN